MAKKTPAWQHLDHNLRLPPHRLVLLAIFRHGAGRRHHHRHAAGGRPRHEAADFLEAGDVTPLSRFRSGSTDENDNEDEDDNKTSTFLLEVFLSKL